MLWGSLSFGFFLCIPFFVMCCFAFVNNCIADVKTAKQVVNKAISTAKKTASKKTSEKKEEPKAE